MRKAKNQDRFKEFISIVRRLRKECPWDREQTHESIRHSLIEEAYEVVEAIDHKDMEELRNELGDLLIHVAMHAVMAEEEKAFTLGGILKAVSEKLIRRHPHVFGSAKAATAREVKANWERLKMQEGRTSMLDGVPKKLPALLKARRLQEKASKVGFDWKNREDVWKKVEEELREFRAAEEQNDTAGIEEEFGDLLFSLVNYARFLEIHPELALSRTSEKFSRRFRRIEKELAKQKINPAEAGLDLMDRLWMEGKKKEKRLR